MLLMLNTVEGVYRNGKIELIELPPDLNENTPVIVTFLSKRLIDLHARQISEAEAAELRARLMTFAQEWDSPEMDDYDDYDRAKASL
jgi:hypothetical protein